MGRSNVISRIFAGPLDPIKQPVGRLTSPQSRLGQAEGQLDVMTTVLAQDHFYSDFLSLHVTLQTPYSTRMMKCNCRPARRVSQGFALQS